MIKKNPQKLDNASLMTVSCYLVGGDLAKVRTQDIWAKAFELFPSKFSWSMEEYYQYPDTEPMRIGLFLARSKGFIVGASARVSLKDGWKLTEIGITYAKDLLDEYDFSSAGKKLKISNVDKGLIDRFKKNNLVNEITTEDFNIYSLAELFDTSTTSKQAIRTKIFNMINACKVADDDECLEIIEKIKTSGKFDDFFDQGELIEQHKINNKTE